MKIRDFDTDKDILVIAEIGNNHEGNYSLCEKMVHLAADAGVGAVKLQTFKAEELVSRNSVERFNRLKSFELSYADFEKLSMIAKERGLLFIATPFGLESAKFLNTIVDAYKISSGDNNFYPLIENVAKTGKPIIMSTGLSNILQVKKTKLLIDGIWEKNEIEKNFGLLHCVSSYPVPANQANLGAIKTLGQEFECSIGYSDHTIGLDAFLISLAFGARIIEKHFTIDKNYSDFRDHQLSVNPKELRDIVEKVEAFSELLGDGKVSPQVNEEDSARSMRRSIVAKCDLPKGIKLQTDHISWVRPAGGLTPGEENKILGKILNSSIKEGEMVLESHV